LEANPEEIPFRDPDVLFDKSIFSAKDARRNRQKDDAEKKDFIAANTRSHRHATAPSQTDSPATSENLAAPMGGGKFGSLCFDTFVR